jgi:hypothetical protein
MAQSYHQNETGTNQLPIGRQSESPKTVIGGDRNPPFQNFTSLTTENCLNWLDERKLPSNEKGPGCNLTKIHLDSRSTKLKIHQNKYRAKCELVKTLGNRGNKSIPIGNSGKPSTADDFPILFKPSDAL